MILLLGVVLKGSSNFKVRLVFRHHSSWAHEVRESNAEDPEL